jgi:hypothetical protein
LANPDFPGLVGFYRPFCIGTKAYKQGGYEIRATVTSEAEEILLRTIKKLLNK